MHQILYIDIEIETYIIYVYNIYVHLYSSLYTVHCTTFSYTLSHLQESSAIKKPVYGLLDAVYDEVDTDNEEKYFNRIYSKYVSGHGGGGKLFLVQVQAFMHTL